MKNYFKLVQFFFILKWIKNLFICKKKKLKIKTKLKLLFE